MRVPCKGCEFRRPGCHASCELYKDFRAAYDAGREAARKHSESDSFLIRGMYKKKSKYLRDQKRK